MKIYNGKEAAARWYAKKHQAHGANVTNSADAEGAGIVTAEETKFHRFQSRINAARERAARMAERRAVLGVIGSFDETARKHFGKSAYCFAREYKNAESVTAYGKTFALEMLGRTDKNAAASVCVVIDTFFRSLDLLKESEERRKAAEETRTASAFAVVAAQLGLSIEELKALKAAK